MTVGARGARPRIVLVTDPAFGDEAILRCVARTAEALPSGWLCVQLRDKVRTRTGLRLFARQLRRVTSDVGALLVVNGDAVVARDSGADGVHLGGGGGAPEEARAVFGRGAWISMAAHCDDDVRAAIDGGADAVLVGPIFSSRPPSPGAASKAGRGVGALRAAHALAAPHVAVVALGGVTPEKARDCANGGADGVGVIRALLGSDDPGRVARAFHDALARRC